LTTVARRAVLHGAAAAVGTALLEGCAGLRREPSLVLAPAPRRFARVRVGADRIIRTVTGLRPFRPSGFVLRSEALGGKTIVHDYGHGGGGVTLSWGTAHLAVAEALKTGATRAAVLGGGAVGLATARLLQQRGVFVTIYARDLPPRTTSNVAGAQWSPVSVAEADRRTPEFDARFAQAVRLSYRYFQDLVGAGYGVRWIENYFLSDGPRRPAWERELTPDVYPNVRELSAHEHPFAARHVLRVATMFIEPHIYLSALLRDFLAHGGRLVVREFQARQELLGLEEPLVMNCTGLGSRMLFADEELIPIKGQLTVLLPQAEVDYAVIAQRGLYMFPRSDGILLGGTFERGEWTPEPNPAESERILTGHARLFGDMR
jgi:glycine/D-amino acid oxidase-like deaminating enzyme